MNRNQKRVAAFSLVEVILALGIATFCLVGLFGLLPLGLNTSQSAIGETNASGILSAIAADLRATPSTNPPGQAVTSQQFGIQIPANPVGTSSSSCTLFFTSDGQSSASIQPASQYRVTVSFPTNSGSTTALKNATYAELKVTWPAPVPATSAAGAVDTFVALNRN